MPFPAKQRICPIVHPDLCLATIPSGGRSGGWDSSIWEERTPSGARGGPRRRGVPAAQESRRREALPRGGRCGHARRGRRGLWAGPEVLGLRRLEGRLHRRRRPEVALPLLRAGGSNSLTGTVLERCRKPLPARVSFIRPMCLNAPVECTAELRGVTYKTAFEWRHRVLATVSG